MRYIFSLGKGILTRDQSEPTVMPRRHAVTAVAENKLESNRRLKFAGGETSQARVSRDRAAQACCDQ